MSQSLIKFKLLANKKLVHLISDKNMGNVCFKLGKRKDVLKNREKIIKLLDFKPNFFIEMNQVHGAKIKMINQHNLYKFKKSIVGKTDGLITNLPGVLLMVKTADCFPLIFFDPKKNVIAALHVGWRGARQKIFLKALRKLKSQFAVKTKDLLVGIGPGIGPCCYKHKHLVQEKLPEWQPYIKKDQHGLKTIDIKSFIKHQLMAGGVKKENIEEIAFCTSCSKSFFSHLKSQQIGAQQGRFATLIALN